MINKRYTDEEIVKALECCSRENCLDCPYRGKCHQGNPMIRDALNFINRQQVKIEQWEEEANKYQKLWCITIDDIETAKSEAYKEFAEKLKEEIDIRSTHSNEQNKYVCFLIDNLVKEMVGEEE